jgi:plastocyanin
MTRVAVTLLTALLVTGGAADAANVVGSVAIGGAPARDVVVYLESGRPPPSTPPARAIMDQKNLRFVPAVLPVVRGTVIEFTNSDDVQHNVFSAASGSQKFDLGTYSRGDSRVVTLSEPGELVVLCNIHMEMEARILVLDEATFTTTRSDGGFELTSVPPGTYRVRLWRKRWLPHSQTIAVSEKDDVRLDLRVAE